MSLDNDCEKYDKKICMVLVVYIYNEILCYIS